MGRLDVANVGVDHRRKEDDDGSTGNDHADRVALHFVSITTPAHTSRMRNQKTSIERTERQGEGHAHASRSATHRLKDEPKSQK